MRAALASAGGRVAVWHVPGRVEVLGKHTDYAGGRSLLAALDRGLVIGMAPRNDDLVTFFDTSSRARVTFRLDRELVPLRGRWAGYPMTVARRLARNFPEATRGADLALASDLPSAAGMSSSSALVIATFLALAEANGLPATSAWQDHLGTPEAKAGYLGCIENGQDYGPFAGDRGVGTFGGSQDHTAILCCRAGTLSQYAFCPVRFEREIAWPGEMALVIAVSGVRARKTGPEQEAFNRLSVATRWILEHWRLASGSRAASLAEAAAEPGAPAAIAELLERAADPELPGEFLEGRFRQFVAESFEIIPAASDALVRGDLAEFGRQVDRSQRGAEEGLGNQVPETIHLARRARDLGAHAASAFGAGFGGSVWAMVAEDAAEGFSREWMDGYARAFPAAGRRSLTFRSRPGPAARRLD